MTIKWWAALALALLLTPCALLAQTTGSSVQAPNGWAPMTAPCVKQADGSCVPVAADAPLPALGKGSAAINASQLSVGTSSTQVAPARPGRSKITVSVGSANTCAFGNAGVTTASGFPLQPVAGATLTLDTSAAIFAACSAATTVSFIEQF